MPSRVRLEETKSQRKVNRRGENAILGGFTYGVYQYFSHSGWKAKRRKARCFW